MGTRPETALQQALAELLFRSLDEVTILWAQKNSCGLGFRGLGCS